MASLKHDCSTRRPYGCSTLPRILFLNEVAGLGSSILLKMDSTSEVFYLN